MGELNNKFEARVCVRDYVNNMIFVEREARVNSILDDLFSFMLSTSG
jgi:hypothetical protein